VTRIECKEAVFETTQRLSRQRAARREHDLSRPVAADPGAVVIDANGEGEERAPLLRFCLDTEASEGFAGLARASVRADQLARISCSIWLASVQPAMFTSGSWKNGGGSRHLI